MMTGTLIGAGIGLFGMLACGFYRARCLKMSWSQTAWPYLTGAYICWSIMNLTVVFANTR